MSSLKRAKTESHMQRARAEVEIKLASSCREGAARVKEDLQERVQQALGSCKTLRAGMRVGVEDARIVSATLSCTYEESSYLPAALYVYRVEEGEEEEEEGAEGVSAFSQRQLPCEAFEGVWESLVFEEPVHARLLSFCSSALFFSARGVDSNLISCNRLVLLHGPPGTGKTSVARGLAQKLAIRLDSFESTFFLEVNAHSLFSKWFSESAKLVAAMFSSVMEVVSDPSVFVCVLIDEVESLTAARGAAGEPSDAIRVVNALLTQLDKLRAYPNVLVLCTSNLTDAIDAAFLDRADLSLYVGPPGESARYNILRSCMQELMRVGIVAPAHSLLSYEEVVAIRGASASNASLELLGVAEKLAGASGRRLRKLPFVAHSLLRTREAVELSHFLGALAAAAALQAEAQGDQK